MTSATYDMTEKQLASTVRQGRRVTYGIFDEEPITGYLAGWDDNAYFVVYPSVRAQGEIVKVIVFKNSIQYCELYDERTFREEECYESMNNIVKPFRDWINNKYFQSS